MRRDFTYVDDIAAGVLAALDRPPAFAAGQPPVEVYNLGNNESVALPDYIRVIEAACGRPAELLMKPMQPGDVLETYAALSASRRHHRSPPTPPPQVGLPRFDTCFR